MLRVLRAIAQHSNSGAHERTGFYVEQIAISGRNRPCEITRFRFCSSTSACKSHQLPFLFFYLHRHDTLLFAQGGLGRSMQVYATFNGKIERCCIAGFYSTGNYHTEKTMAGESLTSSEEQPLSYKYAN